MSRLALMIVVSMLIGTGIACADQTLVRALAESNVNQQYLIESVSISGVEVGHYRDTRLPVTLRQRLTGLVGAPCDMSAIGDLAGKLRSALRLQDVRQHLSRGSFPDRVRVDFEVVRRAYAFDLSVPRFLYHSKQGWTTELNASARVHEHSLAVALGSNGDDLTERATGFSTRYDNSKLLSERLHFGVALEGWHDQWNPSTRQALESYLNQPASGASNDITLYRARRNIAPAVTFALSRDFSVTLGASFGKMDMESPLPDGLTAYRNANAATTDVNYGHTVEGAEDQRRWDAHYGVRLGTHDLGSDYVYSRQLISVRYEWRRGRHSAADRLTAGNITGNAPLFERFVLGNSSTLRGWDRYSIDPLGGDRMAHNSLSYAYQTSEGIAEVFYDSGVVGTVERAGTLRHSVGVGFRQGIFNIAMAFPVTHGRIAPVFIAAMNY